jgi:hypothetical protein
MKCADVRDRVYGLLALVNEEELEELDIRPNYSLSVTELFTELYVAFAYKREEEPLSEFLHTLRTVLELDVGYDVIEELSRGLRDSHYKRGDIMRNLRNRRSLHSRHKGWSSDQWNDFQERSRLQLISQNKEALLLPDISLQLGTSFAAFYLRNSKY